MGVSKEHFEMLKAEFGQQGHTFEYYMDRREDGTTLAQRMGEADIVVVSNIPLGEDVLRQCPRLRMLAVAFTGLDHIDLHYCDAHGIEVQNAAGYSTTAVSELTIGLMLDLLRHVTTYDGVTRQGQGRGAFVGTELRGKTVGVVGTGAIGTAVIRLLLAFGCKVLAFSRSQREEVRQMGVTYVDLPTLMSNSDIVTVHLPLNASTHHLISCDMLAAMRPSALLVNTARGNVVDIPALAAALAEGRIAGAGIDVYDSEPPLPVSHALLHAPNCLCVPHIGFVTREAFDQRAEIVFGHVRKFISQH